jgi:hypothetical protein
VPVSVSQGDASSPSMERLGLSFLQSFARRVFIGCHANFFDLECRSVGNGSHIRLARPQRDQSLVAVVGDADNSLSMRWVKLGSMGCMNHADGAGGGRHVAATG